MSSPVSTPSRRGSRRAAPAQPRECPRAAVPRGVFGEAGRAVPCQPRSAPALPSPTPPCPFPHRPGPAVVGRAAAAARVARRRAPQPAPRAARRCAARSGIGGRRGRGGPGGGSGRPAGVLAALTPVDALPSGPPGPGRELAADLWHPQLAGGGHPEERRARHACAAEARLGLGAERAAGGPALGRGECGAARGAVGRARWAVPREPAPVAFPVQPAAEDIVASEQSLGQKLVIWGTDVNVATCKENFQVRCHSSGLRRCGGKYVSPPST